MTLTKIIMDRSESLKAECHMYAEKIMSKDTPMMGYQDAANVWIFCKLAELDLKIQELCNLK